HVRLHMPATVESLACQHYRLLTETVVDLIQSRHQTSITLAGELEQSSRCLLWRKQVIQQDACFRECVVPILLPRRSNTSNGSMHKVERIRCHWFQRDSLAGMPLRAIWTERVRVIKHGQSPGDETVTSQF